MRCISLPVWLVKGQEASHTPLITPSNARLCEVGDGIEDGRRCSSEKGSKTRPLSTPLQERTTESIHSHFVRHPNNTRGDQTATPLNTPVSWGTTLDQTFRRSLLSPSSEYQSKILRSMANAPRYVSNSTLHNDLGITFIKDVLKEGSTRHHDRLEVHPKAIMKPLLGKQNNQRLKRRLPIDLK